MTQKNQLFYLMQMAGGTFPSGGFSQSWGLETYVAWGKVVDEASFLDFAQTYLESVVGCCEGPLVCEAWRLAKLREPDRTEELTALEELSCALKATRESRESTLRMGKAFLRIMADITEEEWLKTLKKQYGLQGMSYPVIYGTVCGLLELTLEECAEAFVYSTANALTQSAVKLIPLGNTQAQKILLQLHEAMAEATAMSLEKPLDEISNFCPALDIAGIAHENLPVRLYMS